MKCYCRKCGNPTDYTLDKPKFCCHCTYPFPWAETEASAPPPRKASKPTPAPVIEAEEEDEEEYVKPLPKKKVRPTKYRDEDEYDGDEEEDYDEEASRIARKKLRQNVSSMDGLEVEIEGFTPLKKNRAKIGDILDTGKPVQRTRNGSQIKGEKNPERNKSVLEEFKREAGKAKRGEDANEVKDD
jgi:hypothetical protein